ncbi:hypothetical protein EJ06DRAFT_407429 [Trichodelitschia bisporula]|uniref:Uncharacterized protein n=1 Tax=Trichodelitschia bisporula TaxID=703511 RepID=A0A6G1HXR4_9PEZI|nr:hypothetical protein EJ06DRAFT_407429 [Trichodelitschia bisporula]
MRREAMWSGVNPGDPSVALPPPRNDAVEFICANRRDSALFLIGTFLDQRSFTIIAYSRKGMDQVAARAIVICPSSNSTTNSEYFCSISTTEANTTIALLQLNRLWQGCDEHQQGSTFTRAAFTRLGFPGSSAHCIEVLFVPPDAAALCYELADGHWPALGETRGRTA